MGVASDAARPGTRRASLAVVGVLVLAAGAVAATQASGSDRADQAATVDSAVAVADLTPCPGAAPVAQVEGGDPVALTGRNPDGTWLQLRSPQDDDERVWIDAELVTVTTPTDELPVARCDLDLAIELIGGADLSFTSKTTTTTTPAGDTTTTALGETTTTAQGETTTTASGGPRPSTTRPTSPTTPTTPRPTTTIRPTTTTAPPDLTPPTIDSFGRTTGRVWESGGAPCPAPVRVRLSASVQDPSGVLQVNILWRITDPSGSTVYAEGAERMQPDNSGEHTYGFTFGPYSNVLPGGADGVLTWRVWARDASPADNRTTVDAPSTAHVAIWRC